jgi:hypothetical protein
MMTVRTDPRDVDLSGLIDMHMHTAPDVRPRTLDDQEAAQQAAAAGMRAIVLKSHVTCTADRARLAQKLLPEVTVAGGVALNETVGGLNPAAVEAALDLDARAVWMPTVSAQNHRLHCGGLGGGIRILDERGNLLPVVFGILEQIAAFDAILATGHLAVDESMALVRAAKAAGVLKIVITHPEAPWVNMSVAVQRDLRDLGAFFERCYVSSLPVGGGVDFARMISDIRAVGIGSTVLATDFGAAGLPTPVDGLRAYLAALWDAGFSEKDIRAMAGETPAMLLGLG